MIRDTERLIQRLAENVKPVRPLLNPWIRTAVWLALSVLYIAIVFLVMTPRHDLFDALSEPRFVIEQVSALLTGIAAAAASFATVVPGYSRRLLLLPLLPLAGWLGSLGQGCLQDLVRRGPQGLSLQHDPACFLFIVFLGVVPGIAIIMMLRRGAPLTPHLTAAIGGLAAAGIGNFALRLMHPEDVSVMLLVWHVGGVVVLSALAGSAGRYFLNWGSVTGASR
jgi:hypothetical protein